MSPHRKKPETHEPPAVDVATEIADLAKRLDTIEMRLSMLESAKKAPAPSGDLDGRVRALEEWRHALRKHTHQFLHDTGWKEPQ